jgi:copper transport protein
MNRRHHVRRLIGVFGLAVGIVVVAAAPAFAHATLQSENPAGGSTVATSPTQVELTFDENVEISFGSIALFDEKANRIEIGAPHHASNSDHSIEANVPHLADGTYVLTWRVISADSHPVHGAYSFNVGNSSFNGAGLAARLEAKAAGNKTVGVIFAVVRSAVFAAMALLIGAVVFAAAVRPHGRRRSRADALVWVGWIGLVVSTVAALLLQGPYAGGFGLSTALHGAIIRATLQTRYGHLIEIRLVLLAAVLPLLFVVRGRWHPQWWWWAFATPLGLAIAATPGLAGHAATGTFTQLAIPLDALHVTAMSVWLGGLAVLALIVIDRDPDARRAADHFSPVALTSVLVIVASGVFAEWRQVGWSVDAFRDTTYGRLLFVKIAVFVVLLGLAAWSRQIVRTHRPLTLSAAVATEPLPATGTRPADPSVRGLRWSVGGELVFGIAVLVITSMLVNSQPARSALALPYSKEFREPTMLIDVIISPVKAGPIDFHVFTLSPAGGPLFTPGVTAEMSLPAKGIAPITIPLVRVGPNHFLACQAVPSTASGPAVCADKVQVPFAGKWQIVIRALRNEFDEVPIQTSITFR